MHIPCFPQETNIEKGYDHKTGSTYVPKATSYSSQRIQAGWMKAKTKPKSGSRGKNQRRRVGNKYATHRHVYQECKRASKKKCLDFNPKSNDCYVFDGSISKVQEGYEAAAAQLFELASKTPLEKRRREFEQVDIPRLLMNPA